MSYHPPNIHKWYHTVEKSPFVNHFLWLPLAKLSLYLTALTQTAANRLFIVKHYWQNLHFTSESFYTIPVFLLLTTPSYHSFLRTFPKHFDESSMFSSGQLQAAALKEEFREHFRNISRIMDCVGCDKCRLWGKLQVGECC